MVSTESRRSYSVLRTTIFLSIVFIAACSADVQTITLSNGNAVETVVETMNDPNGETVLSVDIKNDEVVSREDQVEKQVIEIFNKLETAAGGFRLDEALIKYRFNTGHISEDKKPIYGGIIFEASKTESGKWEIKKVN